MKSLLLIVIQVCLCIASFSQQLTTLRSVTGTIKGSVVDSLQKKSLSFVTISVKESGKNDIIKTISSNEDGSFEVTGVPYKRCEISFTSVGYKEKIIQLPAFTSSIIFMGKVPIAPTPNHLQEVKVMAEKLLIEVDVDKITYNVSADPDSRSITTLEILRKVPLITIDAEDNISLNGSNSYRILINGKRSSLFVNNVSDVFKSMPASLIKSIEVITNPSARYEAEGIGGIINITTFKKRIDGYNGSVNASASMPLSLSTGGFITYKSGKLGLSSTLNLSTGISPVSLSDGSRVDKLFLNNLEQSAEGNSKNRFAYMSAEGSYELTPLDLLTASGSFNGGKGDNSFDQRVKLINSTGSVVEAYKNVNMSNNNFKGNDFDFDYQRSFKKNTERLFTLSYKLTTNDNSSNSLSKIDPLINYKAKENLIDDAEVFSEHTVQAYYVHPFKNQLLELGVKSIWRFNNSNYSYTNRLPGSTLYLRDSALSNDFNYDQNISAAYFSVTLKKDKWGLKAGARMEETKTRADFRTSGTHANLTYFNVIPNLTLSRKLTRVSMIRMSYSQRIERPSLYYLNPFVEISDPRNIYFGNPNLKPATSHVFNVGYSSFIKGISVNSSLFHHYTRNSILYYTTLGNDTIARSTYDNIGSNQTSGFSISTNITIRKNLSININNTNSYLKFTSNINGMPGSSHGFMSAILLYTSYRFNKGWRSSASFNYNTTSVLLQGTQAGYISNTIAVSKEFLKEKKASATLSLNNPFQNRRNLYTELDDPLFYQLRNSYTVVRKITVSFNYRFGRLQDDIVRKKRGIKNEDLKTSDSPNVSN